MEKGFSVPDADMLVRISEVLDVPIAVLLGSQEDDEKEKPDTNQIASQLCILNNQIANELHRRKKIRKLVLISAIVILLIIPLAVLLFSLFTFGFRTETSESSPGYPVVSIEKEKYDELIRNDVLSHLDWHYNDDGKWFVDYKVYSIEDTGNHFYYVYTWVIEAEYVYRDGVLRSDSGASYPCRFELKNNNGTFELFGKSIPRDGANYIEDMEEYFPEYVRNQMDEDIECNGLEEIAIEKQAMEYYNAN